MIIDNSGTGIASLGRDEDRFVAHVAPGERVVPPVISADTQARLSREMMAAGLDPDEYIVGPNMSINPITGHPEFGWFKKTFKSLKKVAKKVAPVAMFIPGVGQALGAVGGSLLGKVGLGNVASGIGSLAAKIPGLGGVGNAITAGSGGTLGQALSFGKGAIQSGIGSLFKGGIGNAGQSGIGRIEDFAKFMTGDTGQTRTQELMSAGYTEEQIRNAITAGSGGTLGQALSFGKGAIQSGIGSLFKGGIGNAGQSGIGRIEDFAKFMTGDTGQTRTQELMSAGYTEEQIRNAKADGTFNQLVANARASGKVTGRGLIGGAQNVLTGGSPSQGGGGIGGLFGGNMGAAALAGLLGKTAYDSAKERMGGIAETPKVTMDQLGRYQMAQNLGTGGSRADFGLAPAPVALDFAFGGEARQYFNQGGLATMIGELDMREGGESEGPGTGTSDDIPAMLSDGEFVMTAKATRGAGAFDVNKTKSGIELIKGGNASREEGVKNMRELMNIFEAI